VRTFIVLTTSAADLNLQYAVCSVISATQSSVLLLEASGWVPCTLYLADVEKISDIDLQ
jgi:hypothetical protein